MKKQNLLTFILSLVSIFFGIENNYAQITESLHVPDSGYVQILNRSSSGEISHGV